MTTSPVYQPADGLVLDTVDGIRVFHGDCRQVLAHMPPESVHAVVTDPPYELGLMGRAWDSSGVAFDPATWAACYRVLKPGGHLLAFGGTRTAHRITTAIEDAGFEVRDSIAWLYGQGFPKSLDVSKALDRRRDDRAAVLEVTAAIAKLRDSAGLTNRDLDAAFGFVGMAGHWTTQGDQPTVPTPAQWESLHELLLVHTADETVLEATSAAVTELNGRKGLLGEAWHAREVTGQHDGPAAAQEWKDRNGIEANLDARERRDIAASEAAIAWQGWGTALKPAFEPITVARKPFTRSIDTVASNVLEHGTGALNIGANLIAHADADDLAASLAKNPGRVDTVSSNTYGADRPQQAVNPDGRWPTNVLVDGATADQLGRNARYFPTFRYEAKAPTSERPVVDGIGHTTVKPLDLMRWLVRLVTPPGGTVLDPFAGSGTTAEACLIEGFACTTVELEASHLPLILARLTKELEPVLDFGDL